MFINFLNNAILTQIRPLLTIQRWKRLKIESSQGYSLNHPYERIDAALFLLECAQE